MGAPTPGTRFEALARNSVALGAQGRAIHEEQDGLRLLVDLQKLDKEKAVKALESVLTRLKT
jgi:hypothetical protein